MLFSILTALVTSIAFAGDASEYRPLGFSPDGKYFAFAQTGEFDGSGFPYASVSVVEVAKNSVVSSRSVVLEQEEPIEGTPEDALKKALTQINLSRFKIVAGKNPGRDLLVRAPTDHSSYTNNIFSFDYWAEGGATLPIPKYEVLLEEKAARDETEEKWCTDFLGNAPKIFKLSIFNRDEMGGGVTVLQNDTRLPRSRGACVGGYTVRRVTAFKGGLVVQLSYWAPGFEGPDVRNMVVTGKFQPAN